MWGSATSWEQLRQSINCLETLNQVPERPTEHSLISTDSTHRLSILRENEISSNLAFISAVSDDSLKVMGVCVEERLDGEGMTIRIASNSGDLSKITDGFKNLAEILQKAARRGW